MKYTLKLITALMALAFAGTALAQSPIYLSPVTYWAAKAASGTTGTETAITLTRSRELQATGTGTSFVVGTMKKRWKITCITIGMTGNATGTIADTTFALRINTAGAVTTGSTPIIWQGHLATPATGGAYASQSFCFPNGLEVVGDGTAQFGATANSVFVTNAPTWDIVIDGYEY